MAIDADLLTLFRSLMSSYDSTIDTTENSDFYTKVITPMLRRISGDILDSDIESFLADLVSEQHTTLDVSEFSGIRDLVIRPVSTMFEPIRREIKSIGITQSLNNAELMTTDELNSLLSNFFLEKSVGGFATGTVRVFFTNPTDVVTSGAIFSTESGLQYQPVSTDIFTSTQMSFNVSGSQFFIDVVAIAVNTGDVYNISIDSIKEVTGIAGAVSASNITEFIGGSNAETNSEAVERAKNSITVQNLVTKTGIDLVLKTNFSGVKDLKVVGFGEQNMIRDIIDGPATVSGVPGGTLFHSSVDIPASGVHVGGKTDIYAYDNTSTGQTANSLAIDNLTDVGILITTGQTAFVTQNVNPQTFFDNTGYFDKKNVQAGDTLIVGTTSYSIQTVSSASITIIGIITAPQSGIKYEIRRVSKDARIRVPLHNLSAIESSGLTAVSFSNASIPAPPIPGDADLRPITDGSGNNLAKTENIVQISSASSAGNIRLPVFDINNVQLGAGGGAYSDLGKIPLAEVLEVTAKDFTGADNSSGIARGTLRVYVRDKINMMAVPTSRLTTDTNLNASNSTYNDLSPLKNGIHKDTKTLNIYSGPIYKNGDFQYAVESIGPSTSVHSSNPWLWLTTHAGLIDSNPSNDTGSTGVANGNYFYIAVNSSGPSYNPAGAQPNVWPPTRGMWVYNSNTTGNRKYQLIQITEVTTVTGTKDGQNTSTDYYRCKVRAEDDAVPEFTSAGVQNFVFYQGFLAEDLTFDESYRVYYADFKGYCLNSNATGSNIGSDEVSLTKHINPYSTGGNASFVAFNDALDGDTYDFYLEGFTLRSLIRGYAFSSKEQPYITLSNYVTLLDGTNNATSSENDLSDQTLSYAIQLSYQRGATVSEIQDFVDLDGNRIVSEDMLIKPFLPAVVSGKVEGTGLTEIQGDTLVKSFVEALPATSTFEISDLISYLYDNGATHIKLPLKLYVLRHSQERRITGQRVEDSSTLSEIERFFAVTKYDGIQSITFIEET